MNPKRRARSLFFVGVVLMALAGGRHADLVDRRSEHQLQAVPPEDTTPLVAITTVAFGAFRGLVANALWMRAHELQESGQFFELVQLAAWITQLEPNIPEVWEFQAWNLAYNISVLFPEDEDRWRWVQHGLDLLREDGLRNNPRSDVIHWNIGWMFQHKIGMDFDQSHDHYKKRLSEKITEAFDGPRPQTEAALEIARREFRMNPARIQAMEDRFGPLDWRLPHTHVLYWADRGGDHARNRFQQGRLFRMRMQALSELLRRGELVLDEDGHPILALPRLSLLPVILEEFEQLSDEDTVRRGFSGFLREALLLHAEYGDLETAMSLYERFHLLEPEYPSGEEGLQAVLASQAQMPEEMMSRDQAMIRITALLVQARRWEVADPARSRGLTGMARQVHRRYQSGRVSREHAQRTGLPPFDRMVDAIHARLNPGEIF
ncbi:MAG: hypothetical protein JJU29_22180 [Verrucomicrobia bacterium]|nr:hypothetical protein [Verrucomicrobiota bacterium]MCH8513823.1 hypothetical protein [Kiritimatiellia bacterium]